MRFRTSSEGYAVSVTEKPKPEPKDRDEPVKIPLDAEQALKALLKVEPVAPATGHDDVEPGDVRT
jgi:hypothetical protein